jgi:hypothetical protein
VDVWDQGKESDYGILGADLLIWLPAAGGFVVFYVLLYMGGQTLAQIIFWPGFLAFFGLRAAAYFVLPPQRISQLLPGSETVAIVLGSACLLAIIALLIFHKYYRPLVVLAIIGIWAVGIALADYFAGLRGVAFLNEIWPWGMSYVLAAVVIILSLEWLTRKLLKLA